MALSSIAAHYDEAESGMIHSEAADSAYFGNQPVDTQTVSRAEFERLQHQATRLEHLLKVMPAGVVVIDGKGIVRQSNDVAKSLLGQPLEGQIWRAVILRAFQPREDDGHEVSLRDGRKVKLSITPLVDEPGQLIVITDLTETRQLQQRVSHMQRLSALGRTVASMVHQIRTPLSAAILYASNLTHKSLDEPSGRKFVDKLKDRLGELENQVNDMLLFAKSGEQQVVETLQVGDFVEQTTQECETLLSSQNASITVEGSFEGLTILGNQSALSGAIHNLIHNAVQHTEGDAQITLRVRTEPSPATRIYFDVIDNGVGIPEDRLEHIFEPFYTTKSQGTGLGLAVVNAVAKSHGGFVRAVNMQRGACISLCLPLSESHLSGRSTMSWQSTLEQEA